MSGDFLLKNMGHMWREIGYITQPLRVSIKSRDVWACGHVVSHDFPLSHPANIDTVLKNTNILRYYSIPALRTATINNLRSS